MPRDCDHGIYGPRERLALWNLDRVPVVIPLFWPFRGGFQPQDVFDLCLCFCVRVIGGWTTRPKILGSVSFSLNYHPLTF
jgi:hypothetical protein